MNTDEPSDGAIAKAESADTVQENFEHATADEIERERAKQVSKQRAKHLNFVKQLSFHTPTTFMDYLHGDVSGEEAELACRYEYARELKAMWQAAKERDALQQANPQVDCARIALAVFERNPGEWWAANMEFLEFLICKPFPTTDWVGLSHSDRKTFTRFERKKILPLGMTEVRMLDSMGVFDEFKAMAANARALLKESLTNPRPRPDERPLLDAWHLSVCRLKRKLETARAQNQNSAAVHELENELTAKQNEDTHNEGRGVYTLFTLDFRETKTRMLQRFGAWLDLEENLQRFAKYKRDPTGTTGKPLDRLKDLAAWRLYRECGNDWNKANDFAREHRKRFTAQKIHEWYKTKEERGNYAPGDRIPFRDAKQKKEQQATGELVVVPANEADLFGEEADAREAQASAWKHLAETMPQEFAPPGPNMLAMFVELEKLTLKG